MSEVLASPTLGARLLESLRVPARATQPRPRRVSMQSQDPVVLVERLQQGDDSALEDFISSTQEQAFRMAMGILNDRERCQDVLQEVYLTVFQKISQLKSPAALRGWFCQILVNRCRQELRGRKFTSSLEGLPESGVEDGTAQVDQRLDVQAALSRLASDDREVLTLREVMDFSYQQIADNLQLPLGTVRSRIFNARQRLLAAFTSPQKRNR